MFVPGVLFLLHGPLQPVALVVLVVIWSVGADVVPCIIESFLDGSY